MATIQYTGNQTVCFVHFVANPGDIFTVPDAVASAYTRRSDLVISGGSPTRTITPALRHATAAPAAPVETEPNHPTSLAAPVVAAATGLPDTVGKAAATAENATTAPLPQEG